MKNTIAILILSLITLNNMTSQTKEERIAQRRAMVEKAKQQNSKNKLSNAQVLELDQLSSQSFSLMNFIQRSESLEATEAFYGSINSNIFQEFTDLYKNLKDQGIQSNILNNNTHIITKQIPEFLKTKAYTILNDRYKRVQQQFINTNNPNSTDTEKEQALEAWKLLAVHTNFFQNYKSYNANLETLNEKVKEQVNKYESAFEDKYAKHVKTPLHKKYREQIVLSYQPIIYEKENEANFLDHVVIDGTHSGLYFMYYNNVPNKDYLKTRLGKKGRYVHAQLQFGNDIGSRIFNGCLVFYDKAYDLNDTEESQAYLSLPVFPSTDNYKRDKWLDPTYYRFIQCLLEKELNTPHQARLLFGFPGTTKQFSKDLTITITNEGHQQLQKTLEKIDYEKLKEVRMGKPGAMHNNNNINIVKADAQRKGLNVKRIVITGNSYKVYKDSHYPYDIKNKACNAELAYEENGKCYVYEFQIVQEYQGGGTYGKPFSAFSWGGKHQILCDNISK